MFKFDLEIPTYAEWKVQLDKLMNEQPEQAKKYQEKVQKFWKDFFEDTFKIKNYDKFINNYHCFNKNMTGTDEIVKTIKERYFKT